MAKVLKAFPFKHGAKYDWAKWLDGRIWKLTRGIDFHITAKHFRMSCTSAARRAGMEIRTAGVSDRAIVIQAYRAKSKDRA